MNRRRLPRKSSLVPDVELLENRYAAGALGLSTVIRGISEIANIVQVTSLLEIGLLSAPASLTEGADPNKAPFPAPEKDTPSETINTLIASNNHSIDDYLPVLLRSGAEGGQSDPSLNVEAFLDYNSKSPLLPTSEDNSGFLASLEGSSHSNQGAGGTAGGSTIAGGFSATNIVSQHASGVQTGQNASATLLNLPTQSSPHLGTPVPQSGKSATVGATQKVLSNPSSIVSGSTSTTSAKAKSPNIASSQSNFMDCLNDSGNTSCTSLPATDWLSDPDPYNPVSPDSDLWYTDGMDLSANGYSTQITITEPLVFVWDDSYTHYWSLTGGDGIVTFAGGSSTYETPGGLYGCQVTLYAIGASPASAPLGVTLTVTQNDTVTAKSYFDVRTPNQLQAGSIYDQQLSKVIGGDWVYGYRSLVYYTVCDQFGNPTGLDTPMNESFSGGLVNDWDDGNNWPDAKAEGTPGKGGQFRDILQAASDGYTYLPQPLYPMCPLSSAPVAHINQIIKFGSQVSGAGVTIQTDTIQLYIDLGRHPNIVSPVT